MCAGTSTQATGVNPRGYFVFNEQDTATIVEPNHNKKESFCHKTSTVRTNVMEKLSRCHPHLQRATPIKENKHEETETHVYTRGVLSTQAHALL
jgi:hypothetical protein